jgi:polyhydroxyalkanoate synthesis regulator phasin
MTKDNLKATEDTKEVLDSSENTASSGKNYEVLYEKEKKKGTVFLVLTVALTILFFGSLAWGISEANEPNMPKFKNEKIRAEKFEQKMGLEGRAGAAERRSDKNEGRGDRKMNMNFNRFLNDDGTVDTNEVKEFLSRMPESMKTEAKDKFNEKLDQAVKDGKITQDQANSLKNAIIN